MNYVWDTVIKARRLGINENRLYFTIAKEYSPYMEMSFQAINELLVNEDPAKEVEVEINPYYRYHEIFKNMFSLEYDEDKELKEEIFNWCIHLLAKVDVNHGLNLREFLRIFVEEEIEAGRFGEDMTEYWQEFSLEQKEFVAHKIIDEYHLGHQIHSLKEAITYVFPDSYIYTNHLEKSEILIYAGKKQREKYEKQMEFLKKMFLPLEYSCRVYWSKHFGIIGVNETMTVGKIALY